jgi:hypothetical protein
VTGPELSGVDVDLLADYVGGALDGTPDEAVVAALIVEDPAWRDAHALLRGGVEAVNAQLRALGSTPEPMPADVFARLDAALTEASAAPGSSLDTDPGRAPADLDRAPADPGRASEVADEPGGATVIAIGAARSRAAAAPQEPTPGGDGAAPDPRPVGMPSDARRRWTRRLRGAAPIGIAAGVLAFLGFSVQQFGGSTSSEDSSSGLAADQPAPQSGTELSTVPGESAQITESGIDYHRATLAQVGARTMAAPADESGGLRSSAPAAGMMSDKTIDALGRLRAPMALRACIDAIAAETDETSIAPITVQAVDYARYDGAPAVVFQFTAPNGSWVWAVGPDCGTPGVGADKLASVQVG